MLLQSRSANLVGTSQTETHPGVSRRGRSPDWGIADRYTVDFFAASQHFLWVSAIRLGCAAGHLPDHSGFMHRIPGGFFIEAALPEPATRQAREPHPSAPWPPLTSAPPSPISSCRNGTGLISCRCGKTGEGRRDHRARLHQPPRSPRPRRRNERRGRALRRFPVRRGLSRSRNPEPWRLEIHELSRGGRGGGPPQMRDCPYELRAA